MTLTCTRRLEFDAGHRVLGHGGKCKYLHGHRYAAEVTVRGRADRLGMVVDFGLVKERVGGWIDAELDHNCVLHPEDPLLGIQDDLPNPTLQDAMFGGRVPYAMPPGENPTAENLAKLIYAQAVRLLPDFEVVHVRVWETPNSFADYNGEGEVPC